MAGLNFYSLRVRAEKALTKPAKKLSEGYGHIADPVPARLAQDLNSIPKWRPGSHCPDPVPAVAAEEVITIQAFKRNEGVCIDPIPARSV